MGFLLGLGVWLFLVTSAQSAADASGFKLTQADYVAMTIFAVSMLVSLVADFIRVEIAATLGIADGGKDLVRASWPSSAGFRWVWLWGRLAKASFWVMLPSFLYLVTTLAWHKFQGH
jgi:hypothetical protein